ncbi:hypothetical protein ACQP2U_23505 [Nocardia sp. CA-084685]|uniref:hypothetical protein n=1 Tax=Nocardia sp. CA-084685 TaxID=3239970 RepID=UPI003D959320
MYVAIATDGIPTLVEATDCTALHVTAPSGWDPTRIDAAMRRAGAGTVVGDHVWLSIDWLVDTARAMVATGWHDEFAEMIEYARSRSWVSADPSTVRAHIQFS